MNSVIRKYTGSNIAKTLGGDAEILYNACMEYMHAAFGDNVEYQRLENQILLCDETRDFLYSAPERVKYTKGTRPVLDKIVNDLCKDAVSEREKVLAILVFIRDLRLKFDGLDFFYGGTEEELIKKGERYCERVARLMVALCEVAGIPGRIVFHLQGHITSEIYLDSKWSYFDPRFGVFFVDDKECILSVDELVHNHEIMHHQPQWVLDFVSPELIKASLPDAYSQRHTKYFEPIELQCMEYYSLTHAERYNFEWMPNYEYKGNPKREEAHARYVEAIKNYYKEAVHL